MFRTPQFWTKKNSFSTLLLPLSCAYYQAHRIKQSLETPYHSRLPVICVGNAVAGGSGKTPATLSLVKIIKQYELFRNPCVLTRGYGGAEKGPLLCDPMRHNYKDVGDEALLLAKEAPVIIARNRKAGAVFAEQKGFDAILMDDGLQNNSLSKTISFLVVDANYKFGNERLIPSGPLREPLDDLHHKVDAIITIGDSAIEVFDDKPDFKASITAHISEKTSMSAIAFAGIGHPDKFFQTLRDNAIRLERTMSFPDHYPYDYKDLQKMAKHGLPLLTTEKDWVRLPKDWQDQVMTLPVTLNFSQADKLIAFLNNHLNGAPS